ncbi:serine hydrolase domain-containing protein [Rufibacter ruber]|uniref:serine hydrolase domain-containing protein n=1 Tax=Rufibacter ruber TaxID=1783499 RepID=UPI000837175F|nr:serine hydrolase domain-containing protein [Rufibacter ruber]
MRPFLVAFLILCISCQTFAQTDKAETDLRRIMEQKKAVGLAVAVVKDGKLVYTRSLGMKDVEQNLPLAEDDMFRIASISKSFSATSIMQLVEAKKMSLDDDFSKLVGFQVRNPKFPDKVITLKMVLSHTSSILDRNGYFNLDVIHPDKNPNWQKCYADYAPGTQYTYCNLNFNLVGAVIERATGQRFDQYVKRHILDPLGLYGGYCVDSLDRSKFVTLYEYNAGGNAFTPSPAAYAPRSEEIKSYVMAQSTPVFSPTGGMKISAKDLATYMLMHLNQGRYPGGRILSKKSAKLMQTPVVKTTDVSHYGLALRTAGNLIPDKVLVGHTGSAYGLYSALFFHPKEKFGFVVMTNGCHTTSSEDEIRDILHLTMRSLNENVVKAGK